MSPMSHLNSEGSLGFFFFFPNMRLPENTLASTKEAQQLPPEVFLLPSGLQHHPISPLDWFLGHPFQALQPNPDQVPHILSSLSFHPQRHHSNNFTY